MDKTEFLDRLRSRNLTRRNFNKILAAAGVGVASLPLMPGRASAADEALYFTWSGYEIPELQPSYVEKHGTISDSSLFADENEAFQKIRAGFIADVMHPCSPMVRITEPKCGVV